VERLLGQVAAQVDRHPAAVRIASDLDATRGDVEDLAGSPVLEVRQPDVRRGPAEELERAGVEGLALEVRRQEVLAYLALGKLVDDRERLRVLRGARLVDLPDDLDRLLDLLAARDVQERAAGPERTARGGELALARVDTLAPVPLDELGVRLGGLLQ